MRIMVGVRCVWMVGMCLRGFVRLELVWAFDKEDVHHEEYEAESVARVASRAAKVVVDFEAAHEGYAAILVAHGDVLQILRSTVEAVRPPALHRSGKHLGTASVTRLEL